MDDIAKTKITCWPNGNRKDVIPFDKNGKIHGGLQYYLENGKLDYIMTYVHGVLHGYCIKFDASGNPEDITLFEKGEMVPPEQWIPEEFR